MPFKIPKISRVPRFAGYPNWNTPDPIRTTFNTYGKMGLLMKARQKRQLMYRKYREPEQGYGLSPSLFGQLVNWRF